MGSADKPSEKFNLGCSVAQRRLPGQPGLGLLGGGLSALSWSFMKTLYCAVRFGDGVPCSYLVSGLPCRAITAAPAGWTARAPSPPSRATSARSCTQKLLALRMSLPEAEHVPLGVLGTWPERTTATLRCSAKCCTGQVAIRHRAGQILAARRSGDGVLLTRAE